MAKSTKTDVVDQARTARAAGRRTFAPVLLAPFSPLKAVTGDVGDWSETVDAVEAEGWTLFQWAVAADKAGRVSAYPLFRKAV